MPGAYNSLDWRLKRFSKQLTGYRDWELAVAGIASALPSTAAFVVVGHIFEVSPDLKHSAAATGVVSAGAPLGGLLVSLMLRALLARTGPKA
ncbi:hypothetical protein Sste5344_007416 [Sporothrix stenoceras]